MFDPALIRLRNHASHRIRHQRTQKPSVQARRKVACAPMLVATPSLSGGAETRQRASSSMHPMQRLSAFGQRDIGELADSAGKPALHSRPDDRHHWAEARCGWCSAIHLQQHHRPAMPTSGPCRWRGPAQGESGARPVGRSSLSAGRWPAARCSRWTYPRDLAAVTAGSDRSDPALARRRRQAICSPTKARRDAAIRLARSVVYF